ATGVIWFYDNGVALGSGNMSGGIATFSTSTLAVGNHPIIASYGGDSNFNGGPSSTLNQVVNSATKTNTTTTITGDTPDPSNVNQAVTVTYSVTGSGGTPTGNVTVSDGTVSCTGTVAAASCSLTFTTAGAKTLTASYAGDTNFNGSASAGAAHTVNKTNS